MIYIRPLFCTLIVMATCGLCLSTQAQNTQAATPETTKLLLTQAEQDPAWLTPEFKKKANAKANEFAQALIQALKTGDEEDQKKLEPFIAHRVQIMEHFKSLKFSDLSASERMKIISKEDFRKQQNKMLESVPRILPSDMDKKQRDIFHKNFDEIQTKIFWKDARLESALWVPEVRNGVYAGQMMLRFNFNGRIGLLTVRDVTASAYTGFGVGGPRTRTYFRWQELTTSSP